MSVWSWRSETDPAAHISPAFKGVIFKERPQSVVSFHPCTTQMELGGHFVFESILPSCLRVTTSTALHSLHWSLSWRRALYKASTTHVKDSRFISLTKTTYDPELDFIAADRARVIIGDIHRYHLMCCLRIHFFFSLKLKNNLKIIYNLIYYMQWKSINSLLKLKTKWRNSWSK